MYIHLGGPSLKARIPLSIPRSKPEATMEYCRSCFDVASRAESIHQSAEAVSTFVVTLLSSQAAQPYALVAYQHVHASAYSRDFHEPQAFLLHHHVAILKECCLALRSPFALGSHVVL
jgi:hypothetical protein